MKVFAFIHADEGSSVMGFQQDCINKTGPGLLRDFPEITALSINTVIDRPGNVAARANELLSPFKRSDVIITASIQSRASHKTFLERIQSLAVTADVFEVAERVAIAQTVDAAESTHGIIYFGRVVFHDDLPDTAILRSWALHGNLVREVLPLCTGYKQNHALRKAARCAGLASGVAEISFPSRESAWGSTPIAQQRLVHDLGHFVHSSCRHYAVPHILR